MIAIFLESNLAVAIDIENICRFDKAISLWGVCPLEVKAPVLKYVVNVENVC